MYCDLEVVLASSESPHPASSPTATSESARACVRMRGLLSRPDCATWTARSARAVSRASDERRVPRAARGGGAGVVREVAGRPPEGALHAVGDVGVPAVEDLRE